MRLRGRVAAPTAFALANAVSFCLVQPGVPDLWAARARASAVAHGVGLTYWFGWFGGSTPADYSVLTPYLCGVFGTTLVVAVATVMTSVVSTPLMRGTHRPVAASWLAAVGAAINLWCGRVPFLVGAAFAVAALLLLTQRRTLPAAAFAVLSVLASPVSGVFLGLGLSGSLFAARTRDCRPAVILTLSCVAATLIAIAALFGLPGSEPFPLYLLGEIAAALILMLLMAPSGHLRITLLFCAAAGLLLIVVPNGMGANLSRLALFGLPPAAVALSRCKARTLAVLVLPIVALGALSSVSAVASAFKPGSSAAYYTPLALELDSISNIPNHRLELVGVGHAAYAVLLDHAVLARGWETQQDHALNGVLDERSLNTAGYRTWLNNNAVGYVAVVRSAATTPESRVIRTLRPTYLHMVWTSPRWQLYEVTNAVPIVASPATFETSTQASMTLHVPCACSVFVRVRWSRFLRADAVRPKGTPKQARDSFRPTLTRDGSGWTILSTNQAGTYTLR